MQSPVKLLLVTVLFGSLAPIAHLKADDQPPIDIDQFNSCRKSSDCIKVETDVCCSPATINRKRKKKYLKQLYGGKAHVPCGCAKSGRKPHCVHHKCELPPLDFK